MVDNFTKLISYQSMLSSSLGSEIVLEKIKSDSSPCVGPMTPGDVMDASRDGRSDRLFLRHALAQRSPGPGRSGRSDCRRRPDPVARSLQRRSSRRGQDLSRSARCEPDGDEPARRREARRRCLRPGAESEAAGRRQGQRGRRRRSQDRSGRPLWAFISLLVGAFSASHMATVGGRQRDEAPLFE